MSGIDFIIKNIKRNKEGQSLSPKNSILGSVLSNKQILTDSESLINSYNNTLENIKILNSMFLVYFQEQFKNTGCPDLILKSLWVIFCIAKNRFKNEAGNDHNKMLIDFLFAKLNVFFNLENSTNYFKTYFNNHYSFLQIRDSNQNDYFPVNQSEADLNQIYYLNLQEKEFFDEIFFRIFRLNSVLDIELNDNYLDSVLKMPIVIENPAEAQKEELFNISVFDTNEITIEKNENRQMHKNLLDLSLNEEIQIRNDFTQQSFVDNKQDLTDPNKGKNNQLRAFHFKSMNFTSPLINRLSEDNDWNIENANLIFQRIIQNSKTMESSHKITDYDYARISIILTNFYNKNFFNNNNYNNLDDMLIYDNINLDKFLELPRNISPLSNTNSSYTCIGRLSNYFFTSNEPKTATPKQTLIENDKYNNFVESLSNYMYNDTHYFIKKYKLKYHFENNRIEDFYYCSIYENFYENYLKKNEYLYKEIDKIKSSYDKNKFLKLIDDYISKIFIKFTHDSQVKEEEQNIEMNQENLKNPKTSKVFWFSEFYNKFGFDLQFFENLFIIAYYIYLNLLLVGKPNCDECIYNYIKTINHYKNVDYSLIFFHLENLNKLNYSSSIKRILKNFNNLTVSLALVSKDSFLLKKAIHIKAKENIAMKIEEISKPIKREKDANTSIYQQFRENKLKVKSLF